MGKATVISHLGGAQYQVQINLDRSRIIAALALIDDRIAALETRIAAMDDGTEKDWLTLQKVALEKRKTALEDNNTDPVVTAWCLDLTTDLTGEVGTVEIPGERGAVQIRPGYAGNADYAVSRDGQLQPAIASTPAGVFYNWSMLPGWQKWKPLHRYGVLSDLDAGNNQCTVTLDAAVSSAQGLDVNQGTVLTGVPIDYMDCNAAAFADGDNVVVEFTGQDFDSPRVIGFKDNPVPCTTGDFVLVTCAIIDRVESVIYYYVFVWNVVACKYASIPGVTFPCASTDAGFVAWLDDAVDVGSDLYTYTYQGQRNDDVLQTYDCDDDPSEPCTCGECTDSTTVSPDPLPEEFDSELPYIDENGDTVQNYAWFYGRTCADDDGCPDDYTKLPALYQKLVRLGVYRTDDPGGRLPRSMKLAIQNNVGGQSALRVQREEYIDRTIDWDVWYDGEQTYTYKTYTPVGQLNEIEEKYIESGQYFQWPATQSQVYLSYQDPAFSALYSDNTIVQMFFSAHQTLSRSRVRTIPDTPWSPWAEWNNDVWSDVEFNVTASCRACDGANTDPRNESKNTAFTEKIIELREYAISQGHGGEYTFALGIFEHI